MTTTDRKKKTADLPFDNSDLTESKMNMLIERYRHLVEITLKKKFNTDNFRDFHGLEYEELEQFGLIGLSQAIEEFNPNMNRTFQNFAISHISYSIANLTKKYSINAVTGYNYKLMNKVSLDLPEEDMYGQEIRNQVDAKANAVGYSYADTDNKIMVEKMLEKMPEHVAEIIKMRLGGMTLQQIGKVRGVTHQSIQQTLAYYELRIKHYLGVNI